MAFNHHLESDSVGDIGFFNFVRAPIGLVLWALGGDDNKDDCKGHGKTDRTCSDDIEDERRITCSLQRCPENLSSLHLNKGSPSMVRSEISDMSNYQEEALQERMAAVQLNPRQALSCSLPRKKLSWSDESGQNLAFEVSNFNSLFTIDFVRTSQRLPTTTILVLSFRSCRFSKRSVAALFLETSRSRSFHKGDQDQVMLGRDPSLN